MRRTFKNAFILADEMQNATPEQMKMLLTRIGPNSQLVVTGDLAQHDSDFFSIGLKISYKDERTKQPTSEPYISVPMTLKDILL